MTFLQDEKNTPELLDCDECFNQLYPHSIQLLTHRHWTPLRIAKIAAKFLAPINNTKILDIGSGVGKFCLASASRYPGSSFYGVEQRLNLIGHAETAKRELRIRNVSFIHANFTQLNFNDYDNFYFFNSFYENLGVVDKIDDKIEYSCELYNYYNRYLYSQLDKKCSGTRLVTYYSLESEVPRDFYLIDSYESGILKCWIKV